MRLFVYFGECAVHASANSPPRVKPTNSPLVVAPPRTPRLATRSQRNRGLSGAGVRMRFEVFYEVPFPLRTLLRYYWMILVASHQGRRCRRRLKRIVASYAHLVVGFASCVHPYPHPYVARFDHMSRRRTRVRRTRPARAWSRASG